jgi:hypothetical protein
VEPCYTAGRRSCGAVDHDGRWTIAIVASTAALAGRATPAPWERRVQASVAGRCQRGCRPRNEGGKGRKAIPVRKAPAGTSPSFIDGQMRDRSWPAGATARVMSSSVTPQPRGPNIAADAPTLVPRHWVRHRRRTRQAAGQGDRVWDRSGGGNPPGENGPGPMGGSRPTTSVAGRHGRARHDAGSR